MAGAWLAAGLPLRPLTIGYTEQVADYRQRFEPEIGPAIVRLASTARRTRVSALYRFVDAQYFVFRDFYRDNEASEFYMPDPMWDPARGDPDEIRARFESPPQLRAFDAAIYDVNCEFLIWR